jgi:transposase
MDEKQVFKSLLGLTRPWFVSEVEIAAEKQRVDVWIEHEKGILFACPVCGNHCSVYDHAPERVLRHLNAFEHETFLHFRLPRVSCKEHGVSLILSDFGENNSGMTYSFESHLIDMAQECSIEGVGRLFNVSWTSGWNVVERAVARGRNRKPFRLPERIGVDEKSIAKGQKYESLVYDLDGGTVEYVCDDRKQESLESYYKMFTPEELATVRVITMDMWDPFIAATRAHVPHAEKKIVFDRFHAMRYAVNAVDEVRKQEHSTLRKSGDDTLKGTKYLWLWSEENLPEYRQEEFEELRNKDLKVCRAWAIKESLRHLWDYRYEKCMRDYFDKWYWWARHSRLEPIKRAAATLKNHIDNIVTYAKHRITNALGESVNAKIEKAKRMACGFRNREHYKTAIYFHCGGLDLHPRPPQNAALRWANA